ncbi:hypothetical protein LCGC14_0430060 [marine sediment metagenome]|uniref:Uncharacterized protein n=1 Tax=marine sediment metagenome TaxID=412755 RepID=A0A0F9SNH2_9ZZZZ
MNTPFSIIVGESGIPVLCLMDQPMCDMVFKYDITDETLSALVDALNVHETECSNAA